MIAPQVYKDPQKKVILPVATAPYCLIVMVRVIPSPLTVMVAVRSDVEVLAGAVTVIVPLSEPEDGKTVSHVASQLTSQLVLEVMVNVLDTAPAV